MLICAETNAVAGRNYAVPRSSAGGVWPLPVDIDTQDMLAHPVYARPAEDCRSGLSRVDDQISLRWSRRKAVTTVIPR